MTWLLDSTAVVSLLRGNPHLLGRVRRRKPSEFVLSAVVWHEIFFGAFKSARRQESLARVSALAFDVLPFEARDAQVAAEVRAGLALQGVSIGPFDSLIAGHALSRDLTLISHNTREFSRVPRLRLEDWEV